MGDSDRLRLSDDQLKFFYETCIEEVNRIGPKGSSLKIESWAVVGKKLEETYGKKTNQRQLKNKFDYQKCVYLGWCYLRAKTGNIYNAQTNTFSLTNEEWKDFIKVHPKARSLRTTPLLYSDLCATLYDNSSASGPIRETIHKYFQHSSETIHKYFHEVLNKMMLFAEEVIRPTSFNRNPNIPGNNKRERRFFKGAVGALDETLVHAIVPAGQQNVYRERSRGECYQNVLAICDFNMLFTYVVVGWEGTAHDSRILTKAILDSEFEFPIPPSDKYYLCDAAYRHTRGFMAPYRNVRYWLGDFRRRRAMNSKEKFNHSHAKLRNVIERAFGVLKARFPILRRMAPYSLVKQRDITIACFAIHNFIRKEGLSDDFFSQYDQRELHADENIQDDNDDEDNEVQPQGSVADQQYMINLRDEIAAQLMQNVVQPDGSAPSQDN